MLLGGTGKPRRLKPGHQNLQIFKQKKRCIVRIRNEDVLCCARALVTAKAKVDQQPKWRSIQEGRKLQREQALLPLEEAHVPFAPGGYEELSQFSAAPSLYEYQILLVDSDRTFHVPSFGPPSSKQLILLHEKGHYDVITSLPGFFLRPLLQTLQRPRTSPLSSCPQVPCLSPKRVPRFPPRLPTLSQSLPTLPCLWTQLFW